MKLFKDLSRHKTISRRTFLTAGLSALGGVVSGGSTALYAYQIEPAWLDIHPQPLHLSRLDPQFENYRIVQISDIHADLMWMDNPRFEEIVHLVNALQADLILITGDYLSGIINEQKLAVLSSLRFLHAPDGVFTVLGNHDYWGEPYWGPIRLRKHLHAWGIHELKNDTQTIKRGTGMLHLVGLDDLWPDSRYFTPLAAHRPLLVGLLEDLPATGAVILLVHEPDFADIAASVGRIDAQLSGHSHGGQVCLPLYGPLILPTLGERYPSGLYRTGTLLHYTNRGVGMMSPLVRFNCRPEITVFTCHRA